MDTFYSVAAFLFLCALAFYGLIRNPTVMRFVAHLTVTPQALDKVRRAIGIELANFDMGDMGPEDAEDQIGEQVRHVIGRTLAAINPKQAIEVSATWPPEQKVIIIGDIAVISPKIGWLILGPHDRIEPLNVRIKRKGLVQLDNRRPIAEAHSEIYAPPPKGKVAASAKSPTPAPNPSASVKPGSGKL